MKIKVENKSIIRILNVKHYQTQLFLKGLCWFLFLLIPCCQRLDNPISPELQKGNHSQFSRTIGIIINKSLYPSIKQSVHTYASDLSVIEAMNVWINGETFDSTSSPQTLRDSLRSLYEHTNLDGVVLIGDLPIAWYELQNDDYNAGYVTFPTDLFFMDLNGCWLDTAKYGSWGGNARAGVFDGHCGYIQAEIWVSRIKASTMQGSEIEIVNNYFDRVHKRMSGNDSLPSRALFFENVWSGFPDHDFNGAILYPAGAIDTFTNDPNSSHPLDSKENWFIALRHGYEYVQLAEHGYPGGSEFEGANYTIQDYIAMANEPGGISNVRFYNLYSCSNALYTEPNIATYYALGHNGLIAIGSTKPGGMILSDCFHTPLGNGESFGEAFKDWFNSCVLCPGSAIKNKSYGMVLIGAGNLRFHRYSKMSMHQILTIKTEGGSLNREGLFTIADGDSTNIDITPEKNMQIDLVVIDGDTVFTKSFPKDLQYDENNRTLPEEKRYTFRSVHEDHQLYVRFVQRKEFHVLITVQGDGSVHVNRIDIDTSRRTLETVFYEGDPFSFEIASPFAACKRYPFTSPTDLAQVIDNLSDNGIEITYTKGKASFDTTFQIFADHRITAAFIPKSVFKITMLTEGNGTFTVVDNPNDKCLSLISIPGGVDAQYYSGDFIVMRDTNSIIYVRQNENLLIQAIPDSGCALTTITMDSLPVDTNGILRNGSNPLAPREFLPLQNITASHTILFSFLRK